MRSDDLAPVAVVGAGFSGVMTAAHLARQGMPVTLFEGAGQPGRGLAYGTDDSQHLLNVPAAKMSAWPDQPDHFEQWLGEGPGVFARRRDYGRYLQSILSEAAVKVDAREVVAATRTGRGWALTLGDGDAMETRAVVLALGNEPPRRPAGWGGLAMLDNPWGREAQEVLKSVPKDGRVLLIGTGLTMVDVMLSLEGAGFAGTALAVSRRGLLPRSHRAHDPAPIDSDELPPANVGALFRWLRQRSRGIDFRAAVDSLRPHTASIWRQLDDTQRRRFLRHARPWWDIHRHRLAPQIAQRVDAMISDCRLEIMAGRLSRSDGQVVVLHDRQGNKRRFEPDLIVNCTGPLGDIRQSANPLLRHLLDSAIVRADALSLGLSTDPTDQVAPGMWAVGPLTKGMYWEMTAVPDIRVQAERVARLISEELVVHG